MKIAIDPAKCTRCGVCIEICPTYIFSTGSQLPEVHREQYCLSCGHWVAVCPEDAIRHEGLDTGNFLARKDSVPSPDVIYHFLRSRRSCRTFEERAVPRDVLEKLLDVTRYAPTGTNIQDVEFTIIADPARVLRLALMAGAFYGRLVKEIEASKEPIPSRTARRMDAFRHYHEYSRQCIDKIFRGGKAVVLAQAPEGNIVGSDNCHYSLYNLILLAHAMDLGTCLSQTFVNAAQGDPEIQRELAIPSGQKIHGCVAIGFPKYEYYKLPARRSVKARWV
jgi:nitroreductase/NAD-dependent dihydropyrimidine dehydrogenase PreA subunit